MLAYARSRCVPTTERDQLAQHFSRTLPRFLSCMMRESRLTARLAILGLILLLPDRFWQGVFFIRSFSDKRPTGNATLAPTHTQDAITRSSYCSPLVVKATHAYRCAFPRDTTAAKLKTRTATAATNAKPSRESFFNRKHRCCHARNTETVVAFCTAAPLVYRGKCSSICNQAMTSLRVCRPPCAKRR